MGVQTIGLRRIGLKRNPEISGFDGIFTDGTETWRLVADDGEAFNWQHTLTPTGFDGTEDVDYYTPQEIE
jgi:hypothetical protein